MAEESKGRRGWLNILISVAAMIAVGFAAYAIVISGRLSRSEDARRVRDLAIAARNIEEWPSNAALIGKSNLYHRDEKNGGHGLVETAKRAKVRLYHPDLTDFEIEYLLSEKESGTAPTHDCNRSVDISEDKLTVKGVALAREDGLPDAEYTRLRAASWFHPTKPEQPICFSIPDLKLNAVTAVPRGFEHLLLARSPAIGSPGTKPASVTSEAEGGVPAPSGEVVAHIGDRKLPIRTLAELPTVRSELLAVARALTQVAGAKVSAEKQEDKRSRDDALEPLTSKVAGTTYRFYLYPVTLTGGRQFLLLGTVREDRETATFGRLDPRVLAFALALAMLAALTPTMKLALLGPVDGIKRIEVGAMIFGLLAATAFATTAVVVAYDVISVRNAASLRLGHSAAIIRSRAVDEIHQVLLGERGSVITDLSRLLPRDPEVSAGEGDASVSLIKRTSITPAHPRHFFRPDSLFPIDRNGVQPEGILLATARDMSGAAYRLADRPYFRRALSGDFAPGSEALIQKLRELRTPGIWACAADGLIFEQVRSRPDGVPKTVVATRLMGECFRPSSPFGPVSSRRGADMAPAGLANYEGEHRERVQVLGVSTVLASLLSPALHERERFAVLDVSAGVAGLPVLFHSERGRAGVEDFADALNAAAQRRLASAIVKKPPPCARTPVGSDGVAQFSALTATLPKGVDKFSGEYEGAPTLFAATRIPCTDWLVVTFLRRDLADSYAAQAGTQAVAVWIGLLLIAVVLFVLVNLLKHANNGRPAWLWLWPDPEYRERYRTAIRPLTLVAALAASLALFGPAPWLAVFLGPLLAVLTSFLQLRPWRPFERLWKRAHITRAVRSPTALFPAIAGPTPKRAVLDVVMERNFRWVIGLMVLSISVLPIIGLARDGRSYFEAQQIGDDAAALVSAKEQEVRAIEAVALTYHRRARETPAPVRRERDLFCDTALGQGSPGEIADLFILKMGRACFAGSFLRQEPAWGWTNVMRGTLHLDEVGLFGRPGMVETPRFSASHRFFLGMFALALASILAVAFRSAFRGLFGFGVVLEAVPYPGLPSDPPDLPIAEVRKLDRRKLPPRFVTVAAPSHIQELLQAMADDRVDLFAETGAGATIPAAANARTKARSVVSAGLNWLLAKVRVGPIAASKIEQPDQTRPLRLYENLETLMRNRERRLKALAILERAVADQAKELNERGFDIGLLTDLSPLDRLLQSYERDAEELEKLSVSERHSRRAELAGEREDVRWSRLFQDFTTYTYQARKREADKRNTLTKEEKVVVRVVEREVAYLPDHVVAALIPDEGPPLEPHEIADWARKNLKGAAPRAIRDYLTSQLIEHYQLAWSASSHAERLLLHRFAHRQTVNIGEAYALRSLVRRGLVVLDPSPRIMNKSFAQFIRHAEEPETLARWRREAHKSAWQSLGTPLMIALPFALGVVAVIAIRSGESLAALLPFVVSVGPALVNFFNNSRRVPS